MRYAGTTRPRLLAASAAIAALALTVSACGSSSAPSQQPSTAANAEFPAVSGSYGTKPTLTFPATSPSKTLQVKTLSAGAGPVLTSGEALAADYLGEVWHGKVFDNSYDRKAPFGFVLGAGQVIKGWDTALVGKRIGSRVLLVVPPSEGYGSTGQSAAGIKGTDTITFVIDLIAAYDKSVSGEKTAVLQKTSTAPVTVTGALGAAPTVKVAKGAALPTATKTVVIAKGSGAPIKPGLAVLQYVAIQYSGALVESTYAGGHPQPITLGVTGSGSPFDGLVGVPIGSRALITTQVKTQSGTNVAIALVVDVVAQPAPAKA